MNDDDILLASAYLDGDVTPVERARVEADGELLAVVERLRMARALLRDAEPAPISMRERHLAGALDVWDRLPDVERVAAIRDQTPAGVSAAAAAGASSVSVSRPSSLAARRASRNRGWMLAAAAGLVVVLGAGVVLNALDRGGSGGGDSNASSAPVEAPAATDSAAVEELAPAADDFALELAEEARAGEVLASEADAPDSPGGAEAPPPEEEVVELTSPAQLADYASTALEATTSPTPIGEQSADTEADGIGFDVRQCPGIEIVVGPASYNGVRVVVGIDLDRGEAVANRFDDCVEIARGRLP